MKKHYDFIRPLSVILWITLIISMSAGCNHSAGTTESREMETVSVTAPSEPISEPTEGTESNTGPTTVTEGTTAPTIEPTIVNTTKNTGSTEPAATEHTHSFISTVTASTCTANGYTTYTCQICGYSYKDNETAATGHRYQEKIIAPTCTAEGYTLHTCTICGDSYSDNITAPTGHTWGEWITVSEPTYTSEGKQERTCSVCGVTESKQISKLVMSASQMEQEVLRLVNIEREKAGVAPLQYYTAGQEAADIRVKEIQESFSHTRPDGRNCFTVLEDLSLSGFRTAGENIAYGYATPEAVVAGWMNSDGHRANILNSSFTGIAVGYSNGYWVQIFIG